MNIAVDKGEPAGQTFAKYIDFLETNHYTPPNSKDWVDMIRKKGNEATHEIHETPQAEALEILGFVEMLLKFIFEFPAKVALPVTPIP